jgi:hypothetical protein
MKFYDIYINKDLVVTAEVREATSRDETGVLIIINGITILNLHWQYDLADKIRNELFSLLEKKEK